MYFAIKPQLCLFFFFFNDPATPEIYTLPLHAALPICFVPAVMRAFVARHAEVRISVRAGLTPELYTALVQSELDVLICLQPSFDLPKTVCWAELRRSEEHTSELQSQSNLVCRLLLEKK